MKLNCFMCEVMATCDNAPCCKCSTPCNSCQVCQINEPIDYNRLFAIIHIIETTDYYKKYRKILKTLKYEKISDKACVQNSIEDFLRT